MCFDECLLLLLFDNRFLNSSSELKRYVVIVQLGNELMMLASVTIKRVLEREFFEKIRNASLPRNSSIF